MKLMTHIDNVAYLPELHVHSNGYWFTLLPHNCACPIVSDSSRTASPLRLSMGEMSDYTSDTFPP